jgi:hypothetical protein
VEAFLLGPGFDELGEVANEGDVEHSVMPQRWAGRVASHPT